MKRLIKFLAVLAVLLLIAYIVVLNLPQANIKGKTVDESIAATVLYEAFSNDEQKAEESYMGKVIEITGAIDEIYSDENNAPVVVLRSESGDPVSVVTLEENQAQKILSYKEGDQITMKALCNGMLMEVTLSKALIVD